MVESRHSHKILSLSARRFRFRFPVGGIDQFPFTIQGINEQKNHRTRLQVIQILNLCRAKLWDKILNSVIHTMIVGNGLFLMMIFMTYNGHLMSALVLGHGSGHLFFAEWLPEDPKISRVATCCGC